MISGEEEDCAQNGEPRSTAICQLNDAFRTRLSGGRIMLSCGVKQLGPAAVESIIHAVSTFDDFDDPNDPYKEHDLGSIEVAEQRVMWKIDYYDLGLEFGSPDPSIAAVTTRVLTIMLASEY